MIVKWDLIVRERMIMEQKEISRRGFMKVSATVLAGSLLPEVSLAMASKPAAKKPNIVFFLIDDMGWKDLGCFGAKLYETPNIDKLCSQGMRFSQAYTSTAICSPARATSMTGIHPVKLHMWNHLHHIPKGQKILPAYLKEAGYQTWHVGKWHMGQPEDKTLPTDIGFDVNRGGWKSFDPGSYFWPYGCDEDGKPLKKRHLHCAPGLAPDGKKGEYLTDRLTDEAVKLIGGADKSKPFYLNMWHYAVHNPKQAKRALVKKYKEKIAKLGLKKTYRFDEKTGRKLVTSETNAVYAAMLESVDDSIGRIIAKIKEAGEYDNTLFIFYSDNGSTTDSVPCVPLNGGKNSTYEGGNRLPGFAVWKGHIKPGTEYKKPMYIGDIFYTVLDAAGVKMPYKQDGTSWLPVFAGGQLPDREFIWYFPDTRLHWAQRANAAIYNEKTGLKYIMFFTGDEDEMYDIPNDLAEEHNVIDKHADQAEKMRKKIVAFMSKYYATLPSPPDEYKEMVEKRLGIKS